MKDELGRIVLDNYLPLNHYTTGRKEKIWLINDGQKYLFKTGATNYEILAELIAEKLAKQCGFPTAEYRFAIYKGKTGVVTPSFLKKGEIIITGDEYITHAKEIAKQNNINLDFISEVTILIVYLNFSYNYDKRNMDIRNAFAKEESYARPYIRALSL